MCSCCYTVFRIQHVCYCLKASPTARFMPFSAPKKSVKRKATHQTSAGQTAPPALANSYQLGTPFKSKEETSISDLVKYIKLSGITMSATIGGDINCHSNLSKLHSHHENKGHLLSLVIGAFIVACDKDKMVKMELFPSYGGWPAQSTSGQPFAAPTGPFHRETRKSVT